jgi:hypothetical protein
MAAESACGTINKRKADAFNVYLTTPNKAMNIVSEDLISAILRVILCVKESISKISDIKKIAYTSKGNLVTIWFFTDTHEPTILKKIYLAERKIRDSFPDMLFDFTVIFDSAEKAPANFITERIQ